MTKVVWQISERHLKGSPRANHRSITLEVWPRLWREPLLLGHCKQASLEGTFQSDLRHGRGVWGLLGKSWAVLKAILGILETSGGDLRGVKGVSKAVLGFLEASWTVLEASSAVSASLERILGGHGGDLGRSWGPLGWLWEIRGGY